MKTNDESNNGNTAKKKEDALIGDFVRRYENEQMRERWGAILEQDYALDRQATLTSRRAITNRKLALGILVIAASLLLLIVFLPGLNSKPNNDKILADNLAEITISYDRSNTMTATDDLRAALTSAFAEEDYEKAKKSALALTKAATANEEDRLFLALTYLKGGDYLSAEEHLKSLLNEGTIFRVEARYYLGLTELLSGDTMTGLSTLQELQPTEGGRFYRKAQELLTRDWD